MKRIARSLLLFALLLSPVAWAADADVALAQLDAQLALIPAQARDLDDAIAEARAGAARQGDLRVRRDELAVQHAAAGEAAALAERST